MSETSQETERPVGNIRPCIRKTAITVRRRIESYGYIAVFVDRLWDVHVVLPGPRADRLERRGMGFVGLYTFGASIGWIAEDLTQAAMELRA